MANLYFGNFGDVWKHLALLEILARVQPRNYWETHAGSASYPLTRSPERSYGVYHFLEQADGHPLLRNSRYRRRLGQLPRADGFPSVYPGSGLLAMLELGTAAEHYLLCDLDPDSVSGLEIAAREHGLSARARCLVAEGTSVIWQAATAAQAPEPTRVVVLIDPFDALARPAPDELAPLTLAGQLAQRDCKVVLWYGYDHGGTHGPGWAWHELDKRLGRSRSSLWCGDLELPVSSTASLKPKLRLRGCGVVCANLSGADRSALASLGAVLAATYGQATAPSGEFGALVFRALARSQDR